MMQNMIKKTYYFCIFAFIISCAGNASQAPLLLLSPQNVQEFTQPAIQDYAQFHKLNIKDDYAAGTGAMISYLQMQKIHPRTDIVLFLNEAQSKHIEALYNVVRKELLDVGFLAVITRDGIRVKSLMDLLEIADRFAWINPQSDSPGQDFMLWTYACMNEEQWTNYWKQIRQRAKFFADDWSQAYSWYAQGMVQGMVSYHTDKAYNVHHNTGVDSTINVLEEGWVKQNEYALLLKETPAGENMMDFFISPEYQKLLPLGNWTLPVDQSVILPDVFTRFVPSITRTDRVFNPGIYTQEQVQEILSKWQAIWQSNS